MELVMPGIGVLFWTSIIFLILFFILKKWAFPVINGMLEKREEKIATALSRAEAAHQEMDRLKSENEALLTAARIEREKILAEAAQIKHRIEEESIEKATAEYQRIVAAARKDIARERQAALEEIKIRVSGISVDMAEKILGEELSDRSRQQALIEKGLENIKL